MSAAPTKEGPLLSAAVTTSIPPLSSSVSSEDALTEESMELDYADNSTLTMPVQLVTTPQVFPSSTEVVVATNIVTPTTPEAGFSGPIGMANAVSECWADIVSNKGAEALKMDEQAGRPPLSEGFDNGKEFFVVDVVVELCGDNQMGVEGNGVEILAAGVHLEEDAGNGIVRGIAFEYYQQGRVKMVENQGGGEGFFEEGKDALALAISVPGSVLLSESIKEFGDPGVVVDE
ncbi:hypothetical protein C0989_004195 [Termitomyces sp. Mn162]|nr:hypothetical protein C0989_004195 [Termitomyces sp. Mn162]